MWPFSHPRRRTRTLPPSASVPSLPPPPSNSFSPSSSSELSHWTRMQPFQPSNALLDTSASLRTTQHDNEGTGSLATRESSFYDHTSPSPANKAISFSTTSLPYRAPLNLDSRASPADRSSHPSRISSAFRRLFHSNAPRATSNFRPLDEAPPSPSSAAHLANTEPHRDPPPPPSRKPRRPRTAPEQSSRSAFTSSTSSFFPAAQEAVGAAHDRPRTAGTDEKRHFAPRRGSLEALHAAVKTSSTRSPPAKQEPLPRPHASVPPLTALHSLHASSGTPPSATLPPAPTSLASSSAMSALFSPSRSSRPPPSSAPSGPNSPHRPSRMRPSNGGAGNLFSSSAGGSSSSSASASKLLKRATNRQSRFMTSLTGVEESGAATEGGAPGLQREASRSVDSFGREEGKAEDREESWYEEYHPLGGLEVQKYARDLPYFVSYSNAASNWDSIRTSALFLGSLHGSPTFPVEIHADGTSSPTVPPPKKVLDIGAGPTPFWCLKMARTWTETEFVALDAAPSSIAPGLLPPDIASHVSVVQCDFKEPLPFEDGEFDFVRLAFLNNAMSEQHWQGVIEEGMRVLKPGCFFEVVEQDTAVWRKRGGGDNLPRSSIDSSDRFSTIDGLFSDVLNDRFINPSPLTVIPSDLAMNGTQLRSTGRISFPILADPPSYDAFAAAPLPKTTSDPDLQKFDMPLDRYIAGGTAQTTLLKTNEVRVLLAAYADKWASSSYGLAHAAVSARTRARSTSRRSRTSSGPDDLFAASSSISAATSAAFTKEVQDVEDQVHAWADDLRERASIAQLLTSRFGWAPTMDTQMLSALEENIPVLDSKLSELSQKKEVQDSIFGEVDPELEFRLTQMEFARREAEGEVRAVRERLFGPERKEGREGGGEEFLGSADLQAFVCKAY